MEARKFVIGDQVRLLLDNYANDNPADVYTISREPSADGQCLAVPGKESRRRSGTRGQRATTCESRFSDLDEPGRRGSAARRPKNSQRPRL